LRDRDYFAETCRKVVATREWFTTELKMLGYTVIPSSGNFVFAAPPDLDGKRVYDGLYARKILVRYFADPLLRHGLRISIGTREEMETTLQAMKEIC
jgi:histidinol-phosphate aminotransferase